MGNLVSEKCVVKVKRATTFVSATAHECSIFIGDAIPGIIKETVDGVDTYKRGDTTKIRFKNKRAVVAQLCSASPAFSDYVTVVGACPDNMLALFLRDATLTLKRTFVPANEQVPATEFAAAFEAEHDLYLTEIEKVEFSSRIQTMLDAAAEKAFEASLAQALGQK